MFNHIMLGARDIEESRRFYDALLGALGIPPGNKDSDVRYSYRGNGGVFMIKVPPVGIKIPGLELVAPLRVED